MITSARKEKKCFNPNSSLCQWQLWFREKKSPWVATAMTKMNSNSYSCLSAFWTFFEPSWTIFWIYPATVLHWWCLVSKNTLLHLSAFSERKRVAYPSHPCSLFSSVRLINLSSTYLFFLSFICSLPICFLLFLILLHFYSLPFLFLDSGLYHLSHCFQKSDPVNNLPVFFKAISSNTTSFSVFFINDPTVSLSLNWFL